MVVEEKGTGNAWLPEFASGARLMRKAEPAGVNAEGYYGLPMLKRPLWKWEIALYFFLEGVSAGAYVISTLADIFAHGRHRDMVRAARYLSLAALAPCPPLLIADLGRPSRFHHMLRVWKRSSPMNTGAWALAAYSLPTGLLAFKQLTGDVQNSRGPLKRAAALVPLKDAEGLMKKAGDLIPSRAVGALGLPPALTMICYPGVLLSTTSTPVWSRTRFLGALVASSSMSTGAAALSLLLSARGVVEGEATLRRLEKIEAATTVCEAGALAAYVATAGKAAEPLTRGRYAKLFWLGAVGAGLVLPAIVKTASPRKRRRAAGVVASALKLAGGLALKWALVHAGRPSAEDAEYARHATRPAEDAPGWSGGLNGGDSRRNDGHTYGQ
jgi:formate-dependent nitrite reductase membrane component NrfD